MSRFLGPHWRTSFAGILLIFGSLANAGAELLQGQHPSWGTVSAALVMGWGLIKAADAAAR